MVKILSLCLIPEIVTHITGYIRGSAPRGLSPVHNKRKHLPIPGLAALWVTGQAKLRGLGPPKKAVTDDNPVS